MRGRTGPRVIACDNISYLPPWLSDALCQLATGSGFSTRTLYENDEETIFDAERPVILNGIEVAASREDLLDRCLLIGCPAIPDGRRRTEEAFRSSYTEARARIPGALLGAVSTGSFGHGSPSPAQEKRTATPRRSHTQPRILPLTPSLRKQ